MKQELARKPITKSRTIRVGTACITVGTLVGFLQMFDLLESVLKAVDMNNLPPGVMVTWGGLILAVIGGIQVWLRTVTTQPLGKDEPDEEIIDQSDF